MELQPGAIVAKTNHKTFDGSPCLEVRTVHVLRDGQFRINGKFTVWPDKVRILSKEESDTVNGIWEDCKVRAHVKVEGRVPCFRSDGTPKVKWKREEIQAKLFELRMTKGDMSFQAYDCPDCGWVHLGRNPYVEKDRY